MFKQKLKAALLHLTISAFAISSFLLIVFFLWYPAPYAEISGLDNILYLLIGIDLILGPLLTFIVFKKNKPSLKFDLSVIASIQLAALLYGAVAVYQGHPVYVVYAGNRFELVAAKDVTPEQSKYDEFKVSKFGFPKVAYAKMPEDVKTRNNLLFNDDLERRLEFYEPLNKYVNEIAKKAIDPIKLSRSSTNKEKLQNFFVDQNIQADSFIFLPLRGKTKDVVIAVNRETGEIAGTIDIDPWVKG